MRPALSTRQAANLLSLSAGLLFLAMSASPSYAQSFDDGWEPEGLSAYGDSFNGTFSALEARYGFTQVGGNDYGGYSLDVGARMSFPMYVGDLRLSYRYDDLSHPSGAKDLGALSSHSVITSFALHPLYLVLLGNDWLSYTIASLYADVGLGMHLSWREPSGSGAAAGGDTFDPGFAWHWGAGLDVPLWDADAGQAPWLNLSYRNQRADFDLNDQQEISLSTHTFFVGLSWRFNRLLF